jgi:hypothetical protein
MFAVVFPFHDRVKLPADAAPRVTVNVEAVPSVMAGLTMSSGLPLPERVNENSCSALTSDAAVSVHLTVHSH